MPDIQTALKNAINQWEPAMQQQPTPNPAQGTTYFQPTNNITRNTFNFVRDNPGLDSVEICRMLGDRGYNVASVSSLLTQMVKNGMLERKDGKVYALVSEYRPIKSYETLKNAQKREAKKEAYARRMATRKANAEKRKAASVAAPQPVAAPATPTTSATPVLAPINPETILNNLTVLQAKELYARLKEIFGQ